MAVQCIKLAITKIYEIHVKIVMFNRCRTVPIRSHFTTYFLVGYLVCTRYWQVSWLVINTPHCLPSFPVAFVICSDLQLRDSVGFTPTSLLSQTFIWHQLLHIIQLCYYYTILFQRSVIFLNNSNFHFTIQKITVFHLIIDGIQLLSYSTCG